MCEGGSDIEYHKLQKIPSPPKEVHRNRGLFAFVTVWKGAHRKESLRELHCVTDQKIDYILSVKRVYEIATDGRFLRKATKDVPVAARSPM